MAWILHLDLETAKLVEHLHFMKSEYIIPLLLLPPGSSVRFRKFPDQSDPESYRIGPIWEDIGPENAAIENLAAVLIKIVLCASPNPKSTNDNI